MTEYLLNVLWGFTHPGVVIRDNVRSSLTAVRRLGAAVHPFRRLA